MTTDESRAPLSVVVVGGAGAMGRWTVRWIAKLGSAARLLVADIDVARAERLVGEVGGPCAAVRLDATDPASMCEVFSGNDVVINTMGPFSLFARPILEAAIECGCDYLDIDDDWESTIEGFTLDARAREAGVRVVKGIGGSPGVSNLCAKLAARRLDSVSEIITGWTMRGAVVEDEPAYLSSSGSAGAAAAVGLELLRRGSITEPGVHAPEAVIDPNEFFSLYVDLAAPTASSGNDMLLVRELAGDAVPAGDGRA